MTFDIIGHPQPKNLIGIKVTWLLIGVCTVDIIKPYCMLATWLFKHILKT